MCISRLWIACVLSVLLPYAAQAEPLKVVASFSILGDMVHAVAGDMVTLTTLVGPDGDAHVYQPTPADVQALHAADVVIVNSLGFEGWMQRLAAASGYHGPIIVATTGIAPLQLDARVVDSHAWQSVGNAKIYVQNIRDALMQADPAHAQLYKVNAAHYLQQLTALDSWVKAQIAEVPPGQRKVITSHNAFHYFAQAYGVEFIAPRGLSTESEPSAADIAHVIDQIRARHVQALFIENITDPRLINQLQSEANAHVGGTLYSDALSAPTGPAADYIHLFQHNVTQLVAAMKRN